MQARNQILLYVAKHTSIYTNRLNINNKKHIRIFGRLKRELLDSWGESLRKTYSVLKYLIDYRRKEFGSKNYEYYDDYEKLAKIAEKYKKTSE